MSTFRSPIESIFNSRESFASDHILLGQEFTEGKSGLMVLLRAFGSPITANSSKPQLLVERIGLFPSSGEIKCTICNPLSVLAQLKTLYASEALDVDESNGLRMTFTQWRFNICLSKTESEILLHVESRGNIAVMQQKTEELLTRIHEKHISD